MFKLRNVLGAAVAALALSAVLASSASAFSWWHGSNSKSSTILEEGELLPLESTATVKSPFTFKILKEYQVKCGAAKYEELYLEGLVFLGAAGITFESCVMTKPAGFTLVGGTIQTGELRGEISPEGSKVNFRMHKPFGPIASFEITGETECPLEVTLEGALAGHLSMPSKLSNSKSFIFSHGQTFVMTKDCEGGESLAGPGKEKKHKKHHEEGSGETEGEKGNVTYSSEPSFWSAH